MDMRAAVEWIHENIEAFGGDPDNIFVSLNTNSSN
jgi:carboxylesterase type B